MNREIKFRAWNGKKMIQPESDFWNTRAIDPNSGVVDVGDGTLTINEDGLTILQFTGLLDKNGREIYEGDIVKEIRVSRSYPDGRVLMHVIEWNNNMTLDDGYGEMAVGFNMFGGVLEVIGNIYENPSLLK